MTATYFVQDYVIFRCPVDAMFRLATTRTCTEDDTRRNANIIPIVIRPLLSQYLCHSVLNNVRGRYEKCIVPGNKDFWIR